LPVVVEVVEMMFNTITVVVVLVVIVAPSLVSHLVGVLRQRHPSTLQPALFTP